MTGPTASPTAAALRVLVVGEAGILLDGLYALLAASREFRVVATAWNSDAPLDISLDTCPDVALVDLPEVTLDGVKILAALKRRCPQARVLLLTSNRDVAKIEAAWRAGIDGYVLRSDGRDGLFMALRRVARGERYLGPSLEATGTPVRVELTKRERQVIRLIAAGHRTREIASVLSISHKTVEKHRSNLLRKLGLRNASAVAAYATAHGYLDP